MPIAVSEIVRRSANILQDEDHVRWEVAELVDWINDGAAAIIVVRPAARSVSEVLTLDAGTRQEIPANGVQLLDVVRNMGADGATPGRAVRRVDRQLLDDQNPDWHSSRKASAIKHYTFDDRAPKVFYVYPPATAGVRVEALYSELPPKVSAVGDSLALGTEYITPLVSYVAYRALSKDSEFANGQVAALHYEAFALAVGASGQNAAANSPNQGSV